MGFGGIYAGNISSVAAFTRLTVVNRINHVTKSCVRITITYMKWP